MTDRHRVLATPSPNAPDPRPPVKRAPVKRAPVKRAVTIDDVAREARVAKSTVSRALNQPGRLAADTQRHVQEVADRLGYQPNLAARALGSHRTNTIAILVPDMMNPFFAGIIRGAEHESATAGNNLIVADFHEDPQLEAAQVRRLVGSVDGLILGATRLATNQLRDLADRQSVVLLNRTVPGLPSVVVDPITAASSAVEHLASLEHRHIAYIGGPKVSWVNGRRWAAISAASHAHGIVATRLGPYAGFIDSGAAAADALLVEGATAAIVFNDLLAIGMLRRLAERDIAVPADVSIVGFDNIFGADFCSPTLTTLAAPFDDLGRTAMRLLLDRHSPAPAAVRRVALTAALIIRGSTGPAPIPVPRLQQGAHRASGWS